MRYPYYGTIIRKGQTRFYCVATLWPSGGYAYCVLLYYGTAFLAEVGQTPLR